MTLDGTNTWVISDADRGCSGDRSRAGDPSHLDAVFAACEPRLLGIVLTHRHLDHSEGAALLAERAGCGVRAADPEFRIGADGLAQESCSRLGAITLEVVETPGHTSDSRSLLIFGPDGCQPADHRRHGAGPWHDGDHLSGRRPCGVPRISSSCWSALVTAQHVAELLPGHGPIVNDPIGVAVLLSQASVGAAGSGSSRARGRGLVRRARSWRGCMPTSIAACGRRPSSRSGPSWSTSRL